MSTAKKPKLKARRGPSSTKWECPKCGSKDVEGLDPIPVPARGALGLMHYDMIPTKLWCMKCGKAYPMPYRFIYS